MGLLANDEQLALDRIASRAIRGTLDKHLADDRFGGTHAVTQAGVVYRYVPPAQQLEIFGGKRARSAASLWAHGVGILGKNTMPTA